MRKDRIKSRDQREEMCDECEFFGGRSGTNLGECNRFPPNITPAGEAVVKFLDARSSLLPEDVQVDIPEGVTLSQKRMFSEFPIVSSYHWCGEFKRKQNFKLTNLHRFVQTHKPKKVIALESKRTSFRLPQAETSLMSLNLSMRVTNCLSNMGIHTLEELAKKKQCELMGYPNFGRKAVTEVIELLNEHGIEMQYF
jgi:hypothetical protein